MDGSAMMDGSPGVEVTGGRAACFLSYVFGGCIYIHTAVAAVVVDTGAIQTYIYTTDGVQGGGQRAGGIQRGTNVPWKSHCGISGWHRCRWLRGLVRVARSSRIDE
jgi:hypothetical protein